MAHLFFPRKKHSEAKELIIKRFNHYLILKLFLYNNDILIALYFFFYYYIFLQLCNAFQACTSKFADFN